MPCTLDQTVESLNLTLKERKLCKPDLLCLMATGTQHLLDHLSEARETSFQELSGVPDPWSQSTLHSGQLGELNVWALDDIAGDPSCSAGEAWSGALPVWLAAAAGAEVCLHTSAGSLLSDAGQPGFALVRDHINLSGKSPLTGLGASELGPLFPDQSQLHHIGLRHAALEQAQELGLSAQEVIAACTTGPALETPAERNMLAKLGAEVSVQALAAPLIACAHAGLACLSMVSVSRQAEDACDLEQLIHQAAHAGPQLNQWILALLPDLQQAIEALRADSLT